MWVYFITVICLIRYAQYIGDTDPMTNIEIMVFLGFIAVMGEIKELKKESK